MPAAPSLVLPRTFGRYALFDFIGSGGMAEIYLARQKMELGATRRCVVKQILPKLANDAAFSDMLVHEAKLAAHLSHVNVVQVFDLGRADDRLYIAMEYVEGFDLNDLLRRCSRAKVPLPFELATYVMREALRGLDYAHRRVDDAGKPLGIVHRDVSPSNLLISFEGEVKVCDFGIARANTAIAMAARPELDEAIKGKAGYMSPEHARGEAIDARADVFAAGIVLWELAAGRRLYKASDGGPSLLEQARRAAIPEIDWQDIPAADELRRILGKALTSDRDARYPSAAAMGRDLDDYAIRARLVASPLQLGGWLTKTFGETVVKQRRTRERAAEALERGAPVVLKPLSDAPAAPGAAGLWSATPAASSTPSSLTPPPVATLSRARVVPLHGSTDPPPAVRPRVARRSQRDLVQFSMVLVLLIMGVVAAILAFEVR
ncbi:MAG TPA: serine/threonine-protein kinase [Polyangiaceae bacterium]|nr:serine/threonine-protein kinase [Polyangiaceae bacterium]